MIPGLRKRGIIQQVMKQAGDTVSGLRAGKDKSTWAVNAAAAASHSRRGLIRACSVVSSDQLDTQDRLQVLFTRTAGSGKILGRLLIITAHQKLAIRG